MKKTLRDINNNKVRDLANSLDLNYFVEQLLRGKIFFNQDKIKQFQEILTIFFGKSIVFYRNEIVQACVTQYNEFNSLVSEDYPNLFKTEKEFAQQNVFTKKKMAHPMENVKKTVLFYGESTGFELMSRLGQVGKDLLEISSRAENFKLSDSEGMSLLKASLEFTKRRDDGIFDLLQNFIKNIENYPYKEKFSENIDQIRFLNQLKTSSLIRSKKNPVESIKNFLIGIQDTQSHIEYFCRYFHRLVHIKNYGNKKYGGEYYNYNSNQFDEQKFRVMCKTELNDFPELQKFLRSYCRTFSKLRNIRAHQVAAEAKIFPEGFILIPVIENEKGKFIDYKEKREKMINYGVFINKIKLHPYSPYDESEDLFVCLG
ncbi:MAG: hypothetical protein ACFE9I_17905 [Candidatus Hermodarchaeota archaeon]